MGLLSAFGVGGGKLSIEPDSAHVSAGGTLSGKIVFTSGKRPQTIANIKASFSCNVTSTVPGQNGPERRTATTPIGGPTQITSAFTSVPGQRHEFQFSFPVPAGVQNTTPNVVNYRLGASADIDGEVDPGAGIEITVAGGAAAAMPGAIGAAGMMGGVGAMGAMGAMGGMPGMGMPGQQMGMPGPFVVGSQVLAQWQDGQFHPGTIVTLQNGMFGVDWTEPHLGASSWVQAHQLQHANPMGMGMGGMPPVQAPLAVGSVVMAQWQDGQLHPGTIVAMQNGMIGVDWTEPHLGASSWLQPPQVMAQQVGMQPGMQPGMGMNPMMAKDAPKAGGYADPMHAKGGFGGDVKHDPYGQQGGGKGFGGDVKHDPYAQQGGFGAKDGSGFGGDAKHDPYAQQGKGGFGGDAKHDPYAQQGGFGGKDPNAMHAGGGGVMVGSQVHAQWQDGNWYAAKVVALQNGMIGVDWDDARLGASSWVQPHQIQAK